MSSCEFRELALMQAEHTSHERVIDIRCIKREPIELLCGYFNSPWLFPALLQLLASQTHCLRT